LTQLDKPVQKVVADVITSSGVGIREVKKIVAEAKDKSPKEAKKIAEEIVADTAPVILKKSKKNDKEKQFHEFIGEVAKRASVLVKDLDQLIKFKTDFDSAFYRKSLQRASLESALKNVGLKAVTLFEKNGDKNAKQIVQ
jgi:CO dehydrogenase/acetyl-CoA synthase delta subunit